MFTSDGICNLTFWWFQSTVNNIWNNVTTTSRFVIGKCTALINQQDRLCPRNKKLFWWWRLWNKLVNLSIFKERKVLRCFKDLIMKFMNQFSYVEYSLNFTAVTEMPFNKKLFINEEKIQKLLWNRMEANFVQMVSSLYLNSSSLELYHDSIRSCIKKKRECQLFNRWNISFEAITDYLEIYITYLKR